MTKIINAANFAFMNLEYQKKMPKLHETDRLFITQLNKLIKSATEAFEEYNYSKAKLETDSFFWQIFCDNYLEIVKNRIYQGTKEEKASANYTLYNALLAILKLMAPFTPYITEEIYQQHFRKNEKAKSIHIESWPETIKIGSSKNDDKVWTKLLEIVTYVRQEKSKAQKSMKAEINLTLTKEDQETLDSILNDIKSVTSAKEILQGDKTKVDFV